MVNNNNNILLTVLCALFVLLLPSVVAQPITWFTFEETGAPLSTVDIIENVNISGSAITRSTWFNGSAGNFSNPESYTGTTWPTHNASQSFTYCMDYISHDNTGPEPKFLVSNRGAGTEILDISQRHIGDANENKFSITTRDSASTLKSFNSANEYAHGYRYHICVVRNIEDSRTQLYVNGTIDTNSSGTISSNSMNFNDVTIGEHTADANKGIDGTLDNLKIWHYALTYDEIIEEFEGGATPPAPASAIGDFIINVTELGTGTLLDFPSILLRGPNLNESVLMNSTSYTLADTISGVFFINVSDDQWYGSQTVRTLGALQTDYSRMEFYYPLNNNSFFNETAQRPRDRTGNTTADMNGTHDDGYYYDGGMNTTVSGEDNFFIYDVNYPAEFTISFWVNLESYSANNRLWGVNNTGESRLQVVSTDELQLRIYTTSTTCLGSTTDLDLPTGEWVHLAIRKNETTCSLFANGVSKMYDDDAVGPILNDTVMEFGGSVASGSNNVVGTFDEIIMFQYALNDSAITELYNSTHISTISNLSSETLTMYQSSLTVRAVNSVTGQPITYFNVSVDGQNNATTNGTAFFYINGGTETLTFDSFGHFPTTSPQTFTNLTQEIVILNISQTRFNVSASAFPSGSTINDFTVNLTRIDTDYTQQEFNITTDGTASFDVINGTYNITLIADGYAFHSENVTFTNGQIFYQFNVSLLSTNSFNISFYDEETKALLDNVNISFELISDSLSANYTTNNGTLELTLLTPEEYTLRYDAEPTYPQRFSYFELVNGTFNNLAFYLLNTSSSTTVTASVFDENGQVVEDAQIKSLRYDIDTNSYLLQEIVSTNFEGKANLGLQLDTEYYKFIIVYNNDIKLETSPSYVTETEITFSILLAEPAGQQYFTYLGIDHTIYYNNNTDNFVFTYNDNSNTASQGCLYVYQEFASTLTLVNSSCPQTASGSIVLGITPANGTQFRADGYVTIDGDNIYMASAHARFLTSNVFEQADGFFIWILFVMFVFVGIFNLIYALLLAPLPLLMGSYMGILNVPVWVTMGMYVLSLILAVILSRRN